MDERELADMRAALEGFAAEVLAELPRSDQRATGLAYLRGLMLDGRRKSMQPMAERLGVDHQQLQQFLTSSTWNHVGVRRRLATRATDLVAPTAWVIDDSGFTKHGTASPCVARQYSRTSGKVANCQVAVSVHAVTEDTSAVLNWRLFVPKSWDDTDDETAACGGLADAVRMRRARAKIPEKERYRPQWQLALEMLDELASWGHRPPVVVADAGYGQVAAFRAGLSDRDLRYVVATTATTTAHPVRTLAQYAQAAGHAATTQVTWRTGDLSTPENPTGTIRGHVVALRIRPTGKDIPPDDQGVPPEAWLIADWPPGAEAPSDYWLSDLPADTPLDTLVRLATIRWRIDHDYRELRTSLGLEHFEGRSWTGWNRHVTLVTAAQLFLTQWRRTHPQPSAQP